jgi:hypothetical protein
MNIDISITKMNQETNESNINNLIHLINNHWFLDDQSTDLVLRSIREPRSPLNCHVYNSGLFFNEQHRLFIPIKPTPENDQGFQGYKLYLREVGRLQSDWVDWNFEMLTSYETWTSGRLPDGQKLFRKLQREGINTDSFTNNRNPDQSWLVVSKNPIDWLFMSTNQSFTSCLSLNSDYSGAFYMGLPVFMVDPFYFLCFVTTGKLRKYTIKEREFKHFRMVNRSIGVWTKDERLALVRYYPNKSVDFVPILKEAGITGINPEPDSWNKWESSNYPLVHHLRFEDGERCDPYRDHSASPDYDYTTTIYSDRGAAGSRMELSWSGGFNSIRDLEDIARSGPRDWERVCHMCDAVVHEDDAEYIDSISDYVCDECRRDNFSECHDCGELYNHHYGDINYHDALDRDLCRYCEDSSEYIRCSHCGELVFTDETTEDEIHGDAYCAECRDEKLSQCFDCHAWFHDDDLNIGGICEDCQDARDEDEARERIATDEELDLIFELDALKEERI